MSCWAWISGKGNIADWLTKGRSPQDIDEESEWWNGPAILYQLVEEWGLKFGFQKEECLPGEKKLHSASTATVSPSLVDYGRIREGLMHKDGAQKGLIWLFRPADSPWNQGKVESMVKVAKRAIHFAVHKSRLSVPEFLMICYEVANLLKERPISTLPGVDSYLNVLTPNALLLERACTKNPGNWQPDRQNISNCYHLVQAFMKEFCSKWIELCAPMLVTSYKRTTSSRSVRPGDVVLIADKTSLKGDYHL